MAKVYDGYFDIEHMIEYAKEHHIVWVFAVSEDKERGAGKTYSSSKYLYEHFRQHGERFIVFVRSVKELGHIAEGIFDCYLADNYPDTIVYEKKQDNVFSFIYQQKGTGDEKQQDLIGYVVPLKNAKNLKQYRGLFQSSNVRYFYMDEFMPLDGKYLPDETELLKTIYDTVNGKIEDLPVIMTANCINIGNPYFCLPGIRLNSKIQSNTKEMKTDTCVYENVTVKGLADKHMNSGMNRAYGKTGTEYVNNSWIGDNNSLVCKPTDWGHGRYICTLVCNKQRYGVLSYDGVNLLYVTRKVDKSCRYVYNLTLEGDLNIPLLKTNPVLMKIKDWFYEGKVRVSDGNIQRMILDTL